MFICVPAGPGPLLPVRNVFSGNLDDRCSGSRYNHDIIFQRLCTDDGQLRIGTANNHPRPGINI
ncbi:hypothetical protein D3C87_1676710 [compost metagenome]